VDELLRQIRKSVGLGLYFVALLGVLTVPDLCGALGSDDGKATGAKYKRWIRDNVPKHSGNADLIYGLRCSLLHQGSALPHGGTFPVALTVTATGGVHNLSTVQADGSQVGWFHLPFLVEEFVSAAEAWLATFGETATVIRNTEKFARLRLEGLPPHATGTPVFA
jgi:hypothetical protein